MSSNNCAATRTMRSGLSCTYKPNSQVAAQRQNKRASEAATSDPVLRPKEQVLAVLVLGQMGLVAISAH